MAVDDLSATDKLRNCLYHERRGGVKTGEGGRDKREKQKESGRHILRELNILLIFPEAYTKSIAIVNVVL